MTLPPALSLLAATGRISLAGGAVALLIGLAGCDNVGNEDKQQAQVVGTFYDIHLALHAPGLPSAEELKQYQPLVSRNLFNLLSQAESAESRYHAVVGSQAPPMIEGDLFTSLFEGATSYSVESCDTDEQRQRSSCTVAFSYKKDGAEESWNDKILLIQEDKHWRIDDIEFIGNDQSSQREYLSDTLADAIKEAG